MGASKRMNALASPHQENCNTNGNQRTVADQSNATMVNSIGTMSHGGIPRRTEHTNAGTNFPKRRRVAPRR
jgi:hypothetical protein